MTVIVHQRPLTQDTQRGSILQMAGRGDRQRPHLHGDLTHGIGHE
jgi:hypothetical protein